MRRAARLRSAATQRTLATATLANNRIRFSWVTSLRLQTLLVPPHTAKNPALFRQWRTQHEVSFIDGSKNQLQDIDTLVVGLYYPPSLTCLPPSNPPRLPSSPHPNRVVLHPRHSLAGKAPRDENPPQKHTKTHKNTLSVRPTPRAPGTHLLLEALQLQRFPPLPPPVVVLPSLLRSCSAVHVPLRVSGYGHAEVVAVLLPYEPDEIYRVPQAALGSLPVSQPWCGCFFGWVCSFCGGGRRWLNRP